MSSCTREQVRHVQVILLAPDLAVVARVYKLDADRKIIAPLNDPPRQHGLDIKLVPDLARVRVAPFVAKDRVARHDLEVRRLREVVYQAFGYAVRQVLRILVLARR